MSIKRTVASGVMVTLLSVLWIAGSATAHSLPNTPESGGVGLASVLPPLLQYQGRLTDPDTGEPVDDGAYTMTFRLYDVESGGDPLWTETKDVMVDGGVFSTALGDTAALDPGLFNGQSLWLGTKVGADAEATPRQLILPVAYAVSLVPGAVVSTTSTAPALTLVNSGAGDGLEVQGTTTLTGDLSVSGSLIGGSHEHSGGDISSGTVAEPRIDPQIARDNEIMPTVLGSDGSGSELDADRLDGQDSGYFSPAGHTHSGDDITSGTVADAWIDAQIARDGEVQSAIESHASDSDPHHARYTDGEAWGAVLANDGPNSTLDADYLDGMSSGSFATSGHDHWGSSWSGSGTGLTLNSTSYHGLQATSDTTVAGGAAVYGRTGGSAPGIPGQEVGVRGEAADGYGVAGASTTSIGVYGYSSQNTGIWGTTGASGNPGVYGYNTGSGNGVQGYSASGDGVLGSSGSTNGAGVRGESGSAWGELGSRSYSGAPYYFSWSYGVYGVGSGASFDYGGYFDGETYGAYATSDLYGVYGSTTDASNDYGLYTPDNVYVGGKLDLVGAVDPVIGERFEVHPEGEYAVGDLLVIDPESPYLILSTEPNDTKVIGVVGPTVDIKDGELMVIVLGYHGAKPDDSPPPGEPGEVGATASEEAPTRTVARIKADADTGAIQRGDLLTTSPNPGHAMRAEPVDVGGVEIYRPGTIIGKALESLDAGQGLIEVFVALQ